MAELQISHTLLKRLAKRTSAPEPDGRLVLFGLRGVVPIDVSNREFQDALAVRLTDIDNVHMRCTIGQWRRDKDNDKGKVALFPGSTVPNLPAIRRHL